VNNAPTCLKDKGGCSHTCTSLTKGRTCSCPASYTLALDGMKCFLTGNQTDLLLSCRDAGGNGSAMFRTCNMQFVINILSQFFSIAAKPDVSLLYSTASSIWSVSIYYAEKRVSFARIPIQGQHIIAFFYNAKNKYLYWADAKDQKIRRSHLDGTNKQVIVK
jgi:hypothetical protein